jgi:hypothetical protein
VRSFRSAVIMWVPSRTVTLSGVTPSD